MTPSPGIEPGPHWWEACVGGKYSTTAPSLLPFEMADVVVAVGPKLKELYSAYLSWRGTDVFDLTPGIFSELSNLRRSVQDDSSKPFRVLFFGRGDSEDFVLNDFDIAAHTVAKLNDKSYVLHFVGADDPDEVAEKFKNLGLSPDQLIVRSFVNHREDLGKILCAVDLCIASSRTEGFGLTALSWSAIPCQ